MPAPEEEEVSVERYNSGGKSHDHTSSTSQEDTTVMTANAPHAKWLAKTEAEQKCGRRAEILPMKPLYYVEAEREMTVIWIPLSQGRKVGQSRLNRGDSSVRAEICWSDDARFSSDPIQVVNIYPNAGALATRACCIKTCF